MKSARILLLLGFIAVSTSASAQAAVSSNLSDQKTSSAKASYTLCRNQKTVRTLRVDRDEKKSCVAIYTKSGVDKEVARGLNVMSCQKVVENIKINLDKAGWKCKDVGDATMTSTQSEN
jgi:hypothetical protein